MKKLQRQLLIIFLIIVLLLPFTGINIMRMSCDFCRDTHCSVQLVPIANHCPCTREHNKCCGNHKHKDKTEHTFYKVSNDYQAEYSAYTPPIVGIISELWNSTATSMTVDFYSYHLESNIINPPPLSRSQLCIFIC